MDVCHSREEGANDMDSTDEEGSDFFLPGFLRAQVAAARQLKPAAALVSEALFAERHVSQPATCRPGTDVLAS